MATPKLSVAFCAFILGIFAVIGAGAQTTATTVRPYKFGFTIDEQQHRYEKRDERGIVMGEFGFITADGIYHVTVYATDEEGKFRILAMKSYPYESPPKTIDMIVKPKPKEITTAAPVPSPPSSTRHPSFGGREACSGCKLTKKKNVYKTAPATVTANGPNVPNVKTDIRTLSKILPNGGPTTISGVNLNAVKAPTTTTAAQPPNYPKNVNPALTTSKVTTKPSINVITQPRIGSVSAVVAPVLPNLQNTGLQPPPPPTIVKLLTSQITKTGLPAAAGPVLPKKPAGTFSGSSIVGSTSDSGDLYRFKYLLDYNGHTETGSRNGNKQGNFYSIGEDNIERTIEYVANEFGYQPRIRWRKLNANEIKSKDNTLKDYEFVWFKE